MSAIGIALIVCAPPRRADERARPAVRADRRSSRADALGVVLLLPGLCSLLTMLTMIQEMRQGDSRMVDFATIWVVTFIISGVGIYLVMTSRTKRESAEPPA